jgi:hypothetical protein
MSACRCIVSGAACACSLAMAVVSTLAFLGAVSCATHAVLIAGPPGTPPPAAAAADSTTLAAAGSHAASAAAGLASVALLCVFVGGVNVALRFCSLGLGLAMLVAHMWMRTASAGSLAGTAEWMLRTVLLPARASMNLGQEWDCLFLGPADALFMLAALRHAASVLSSMMGALAGVADGMRTTVGMGALAALAAAQPRPMEE